MLRKLTKGASPLVRETARTFRLGRWRQLRRKQIVSYQGRASAAWQCRPYEHKSHKCAKAYPDSGGSKLAQNLRPAVCVVCTPGFQTSRFQRRPGRVPMCVLQPEVLQVAVKTKNLSRAALSSTFCSRPKTQGFCCAQSPSVSRKL